MSSDATAWARFTTGHRSAGEKLVLIMLADYADPDRFLSWPTLETLAEVSVMDVGEVVECLDSLEARGFVTCLKRDGPGHPWLFRLNVAGKDPAGAVL